jgi:hypothetical protein
MPETIALMMSTKVFLPEIIASMMSMQVSLPARNYSFDSPTYSAHMRIVSLEG